MSEEPIVDKLKEKLQRTLKSKAVLAERSKQLTKQVEDFRKREDQTDQFVGELLERQRELNFMLHRASSVLYSIQEANAVLSTEFTELVKELPAPNAPDWEERVNRINELFKKSGSMADEVQDDVFRKGMGAKNSAEIHVTKVEPETPAEPVAEPEPIPEPTQEEDIPAAEFSDDAEPVDTVVPGPEELPEPVVVDAQFSDPDPVNPNVRKRLDQLFGQAGSNTEVEPVNLPETDDSADDKPGLLSRIQRLMFGRKGKKSSGEVEFQPEPEMTDPEPEPVEEKADDEAVNDSNQSKEPVIAEVSVLLDDTAYELEQIPMDLIPDAKPRREFIAPTLTAISVEKRLSLWERLIKRITAGRHHFSAVSH